MGRLVADPELRHTQNNTPVASFRLAVDRRSKNDEADFIDIVAWDKQGEFVSKWFNKGKLVAVVGRLQVRKWQDKDGNNRYSTEVVAEECHFAESKKTEQGGYQEPAAPRSAPARQQPQPSAPPPYSETAFSDLLDDDEELPF